MTRMQTLFLRALTVADEMQATRLAERPAWAGGSWHLLLSEPLYDCALAAAGIERFTALSGGLGAQHDLTDVDLAVLGKIAGTVQREAPAALPRVACCYLLDRHERDAQRRLGKRGLTKALRTTPARLR